MIIIKQHGDFKKTESFLNRMSKADHFKVLEKYAKEGVVALSAATPVDTGMTANAWSYNIVMNKTSATISWANANIVNGVPIAVVLQYGHGTRDGGFVQGRDYINPALKPIFDKLANEVWKEVTRP